MHNTAGVIGTSRSSTTVLDTELLKPAGQQESVIDTPTGPKSLTHKEYKDYMRVVWTQRKGVVPFCGHKLGFEDTPRTNCESCWFAYFNTHGEATKVIAEMYEKHGGETLKAMRGLKFLKMFRKFMATLARFKDEQEKPATVAEIIQQGCHANRSGVMREGWDD